MITAAFQIVSAQPALLPLYRQMIDSVVVTLPNTRQFSNAIDAVFAQIEAELAQPDEETPQNAAESMKAQADMVRAQADMTKNQNEFAIKQQQNAIKEQEVQNKYQIDKEKLMLTNKEMNRQFALKEAELAVKGSTNENITTGLVGSP
jgi:Skp family chaperone for outer membrane proteins